MPKNPTLNNDDVMQHIPNHWSVLFTVKEVDFKSRKERRVTESSPSLSPSKGICADGKTLG